MNTHVKSTWLSLCILSCLVFLQSSRADPADIAALKQTARTSACAAHDWIGRGRAPATFVEGVALVFARSVCHADRKDVKVVSAAVDASKTNTDALAWYDRKFRALGMRNDSPGLDTLRHSYVLLLGLGMMESSGKYCEGRDVSECFDEADSAEAGPFQTSYGARKSNPALDELFQHYSTNQDGCMLDQFKGNFSCPIRKSHNAQCPDATSDIVGTGPGADWQKLTKSCPAFATEYAAVVLRTSGGKKGEFNPVRKQQAEVVPACDAMLETIQKSVQQNPAACAALE